MPGSVTTTAGETFTNVEHVDLARLIFKRFGKDPEEATNAWRRMLGNSCPVSNFMALVDYPEHTPHCAGSCATDLQEPHTRLLCPCCGRSRKADEAYCARCEKCECEVPGGGPNC
jgi:hypothetical protein